MTTSKSIFTRYWLLSILLQGLALAFLGLPTLESHREALAATLGLQSEALWILVAVAVLTTMVVILGRLNALITDPLRFISEQCTSGNPTAAHRDAHSREEKIIRDYLHQQYERGKGLSSRLERVENELATTIRERDRSIKKREEAEDLAANFARIRQELSIDIATLKAEKQALEEELGAERQAKVGSEIENRTDEIYSQMERAISATALKSIWLPRLLGDLRTPVNIIQGLAHRMLKSWESTSLGQLRENAEEIYFQSEVQLKRINDIMDRKQTSFVNGAKGGETFKALELGRAQKQLGMPRDTLQMFLDELNVEAVSSSDTISNELDSIVMDPAAQRHIREFVSDVRSRLETSAIELRLDCNESLEPDFELTIEGKTENGEGLGPEDLNQLARRNGIEAEICEAVGSQLKICFSTANIRHADSERLAVPKGR